MRTLRTGMTGPDVRRWQQALIDKGYLRATADGSFGGLTEAATIAFQRDNGLSADGVAGPAAFARMGLADEPEPSAPVTPASSGAGPRITVSAGLLGRIMPQANAARVAEYASFLQKAMEEFAIDTPARAAAFLAQLAHESGQFRYMQEIWGPTATQRRYEGRKDLGNTQPGDGKRFMGRGPIQLTGRANYRLFGDALGVDLVGKPELAATKEVGFRVAGLYWQKRGLNPLADRGEFVTITKRINGGTNGLADRKQFWERAKQVLAVRGLVAAAARGLRRLAADEAPDPRFRRGLDGPGEVTPTAAERSAEARPMRAAGTRPAAKRRPTKKAAARAQKPKAKAAKAKPTKAKTAKRKAARKVAKKQVVKKRAAKRNAPKRKAAKKKAAKKPAAKKRATRATAARPRKSKPVRKKPAAKSTRRRGR